jgi:NAD(P)-dependent dehydrogenase (short-subunit alcohol dehydrogenase family)
LVEAAGTHALGVRCDVSDPDAVTALQEAALDRFGRVDVLVHNAGIYPITPFEEITLAEWRRVMAVNLDSFFLLCQAVLPDMRGRGWGRIVAMSSTAFHAGVPGFVHYVASRVASSAPYGGWRRSWPTTASRSTRSPPASSAPRARRKDRTRRWGSSSSSPGSRRSSARSSPGDLVGALAFLVSDDAAFITGQTIAVDGGFVRA